MKKFFSIIPLVLCLLTPVQAGSIAGKWYCPQAFFDSLGLALYPKISGYYEFRKDGTFSVRISGELQSAPSSEYFETGAWKNPGWMNGNPEYQTLLIKVKGFYSTNGSAITTAVDSNDVHVYINTGLSTPDEPDAEADWDEVAWTDLKMSTFDIKESHAAVHSRTIRREKMHVWRWKDLPVAVTGGSLLVGGNLKFTKKPVKSRRRKMDIARYAMMNRKKYAGKRKWVGKMIEESVYSDSLNIDMYCLGLAYIDGLGVEKDSSKAVELLEKAANAGYTNAFHELGMIYKTGRGGVSLDYGKAYGYFHKGAVRNNGACMYALGCMLYKGLGCKQSYKNAIRMLLPAANYPYKDARALYLLGMFCRNGYGVDKNYALASKCLNISASMKYPEAKKELAWPHEETHMSGEYLHDARYRHLPDSMPDIRPGEGGIGLAAGNYEGFLVMYDWSGKYILLEKPLNMAVTVNGRKADGRMTVGTEEVEFNAEIAEDGSLKFMGGDIQLDGRYGAEGRYILVDMPLHAEGGRLTGRLNTYSAKQKEPGRPMYVELRPIMAQAKGRQ